MAAAMESVSGFLCPMTYICLFMVAPAHFCGASIGMADDIVKQAPAPRHATVRRMADLHWRKIVLHVRFTICYEPPKGTIMKTALRIVLGLILLTASIAKLSNMSGFVAVLHSYHIFPQGLHWPAAIMISGAELVIGSWLFWGRHLRQAAWTSLVLHSVYACFAAFMLLRNVPILNCGCFGSYLARPLSWMTVGQNLVLVALSLLLARLARPVRSLYTR
ncbi:hypothetical protein ET418_00055 [Oryzomonas rubra]|uniref:Methylamine utilisation protein MauE domain-containing protein n=2 Tax=Oryzomonas rubra TaxID=2509454 RepID=A0A5A9XTI4_9BACT|nr:hypothetical protein ET418_00055 [Oryzomonas rubra]